MIVADKLNESKVCLCFGQGRVFFTLPVAGISYLYLSYNYGP